MKKFQRMKGNEYKVVMEQISNGYLQTLVVVTGNGKLIPICQVLDTIGRESPLPEWCFEFPLYKKEKRIGIRVDLPESIP